MSLPIARPIMRTSALRTKTTNMLSTRTIARFESSTAQKATETAKDGAAKASKVAAEYQAKAAEGLSRVTSAAGPAIAGAAKGVSSALGKVGGRTGRFIGFVEKQVPRLVYYSRVGLELSKLVFQGQKMSPPSISTFQSYFQGALKTVKNPSSLLQSAQAQPTAIAQQARGLSRAQIVAGGVILAECLGFFTVGEMIGRFKLVGYHGESAAAHH